MSQVFTAATTMFFAVVFFVQRTIDGSLVMGEEMVDAPHQEQQQQQPLSIWSKKEEFLKQNRFLVAVDDNSSSKTSISLRKIETTKVEETRKGAISNNETQRRKTEKIDDDNQKNVRSSGMNEKNSRIIGGAPPNNPKHKVTISNQRPSSHINPVEDRTKVSTSITTSSTNDNDGDGPLLPQSRIIGGQPVDPKDRYPFMVVLYDINDQYISGATLIAPDIVLTAAHSTVVNIISVGIGRFDLSDSTEDYEQIPVETIVVNPNFRPRKFNHDAAIIKLKFPSTYKPVKLNGNPEVPPDNTQLTVMGWGVDESGTLSDVLKETTVTSMTNEECENETSYLDEDITDAMLCATGNGVTDACDGDSGGPLILQQSLQEENSNNEEVVQVGIVSFGRGCANIDFPGVYTRVSYILPWIQYEVCLLSPDYCNNDIIPQCQDVENFITNNGETQTCDWVGRREYTRCPMYGLIECPVTCGNCIDYIQFPDGQEDIVGAFPFASSRQRTRVSDSEINNSSGSTTAASSSTTTTTVKTKTTSSTTNNSEQIVIKKNNGKKENESASSLSSSQSLWSMLVSLLTGHH